MTYTFVHPEYFWLMAIPVLMAAYYIWIGRRQVAALKISSVTPFARMKNRGVKIYLRHILPLLRVAAVALIIIALARPQTSDSWEERSSEGIDVVLSLDISTSMLARDFTPNRLEAAKEVATQFVLDRKDDKIGLVVFAGESFTQCPLTTDKAVLVNLMRDVKSGLIEDGTAIGVGLANAVNRLKESTSKSKVVILLTDGVNNVGAVAPITAAELAKTFGIRVYAIGVGTMGTAPYPVQTPWGERTQNVEVEIDEATLTQIASLTGGKYFRATDNEKLRQIYDEIDQMEKSKIEVKHFTTTNEHYLRFALLALLLLMIEAVLRYTLLRRIP